MNDAPVVAYEVADRIASIALDRPDRGNAVNLQLCVELVDALERADADDDVAVVVLSGRGRNFCVGADLSEGFHHGGREPSQRFTDFVERFGSIEGVPRDPGGVVTLRMAAMLKPIVVAVSGAAVGAGASFTLPCDLRILGESSRVGFVFPRRGIASESAASWLLPRIVGMTRASEWVLTGRLLPAEETLQGGLATRVVPDTEVLEAAYDVAREIVANTSTVAVSMARQLLWSMLSAPSPWDAHRVESAGVYDLAGREDVAEGVRAFLEKRSPRFPLRVPRDYPDYAPRWPQQPEAVPQ